MAHQNTCPSWAKFLIWHVDHRLLHSHSLCTRIIPSMYASEARCVHRQPSSWAIEATHFPRRSINAFLGMTDWAFGNLSLVGNDLERPRLQTSIELNSIPLISSSWRWRGWLVDVYSWRRRWSRLQVLYLLQQVRLVWLRDHCVRERLMLRILDMILWCQHLRDTCSCVCGRLRLYLRAKSVLRWLWWL